MMSQDQITQLLKQSRLHLKHAKKELKTSPKESVRFKINRDVKTACVAEIDVLKQILKG